MPFLSLPHFLFVFASAAVGVCLPRKAKVAYLLALSWVWFLWFDPRFFPLLAATTAFDFWVGRRLEDSRWESWRKPLFFASVGINLALVFFFKALFYLGKAASGPGHAPTSMEFHLLALFRWGMPLGVSFFTFHSISYVVDVYRRRIEPCRSFLQYALFVSFFPKIAAGPIERFSAFSRQLKGGLSVGRAELLHSLRLLVMGLFLKLVVGDNLTLLVRMNFDTPAEHRLFSSLLGTYAFTAQIYADFLGYTLLARGTALLFGIKLSRNFRAPYGAVSLTDFWHRWHISLSSWFRDYLYLPLGGNRRHRGLNIVVTMGLAGFWHGIGLPFLFWGLYHGFLLALTKPLEAYLAGIPRWIARWTTFHVVAMGWIFFRADSAAQAFDVLAGFLRPDRELSSAQMAQVFLFLWLVLPWWLVGSFQSFFRRMREQRWFVYVDAAVLGAGLVLVVVFGSISAVPFLYFKF